jgi:5'-nucleotidase
VVCRIFPLVSGLRVSWDSRRPSGQRVLGVWLLQETPNAPSERSDISSGTGTAALVDGEFIKREKNGRTYKIVTREYMATGHCGYTALLGHKYVIEGENGQPMSNLVREYLQGGYRYTG